MIDLEKWVLRVLIFLLCSFLIVNFTHDAKRTYLTSSIASVLGGLSDNQRNLTQVVSDLAFRVIKNESS